VDPQVEAAMQTPDGAWRVEIVRRGRDRWYRIADGVDVIDWLSISSVERIVAEAGVDMGDLVPATAQTDDAGGDSRSGAA
jgi:hypothetical protein